MAKKQKRKSTVAKQLVRGLAEFSKKLKSGKPVKETRVRVMVWGLFHGGNFYPSETTPNEHLARSTARIYRLDGGGKWTVRLVTIIWSKPVTLKRK